MMTENDLWTEKYRPKTVDEYIWTDAAFKEDLESWIRDKKIPNLLLHGPAGTGKTSAALLLVNALAEPGDVLKINGSKQNKIEHIRDIVTPFAETTPNGDYKYIIIDECDRLADGGGAAMKALKNDMEEFSGHCRFILTTNYPNKVEAPIVDRCVSYQIQQVDKDKFLERTVTILSQEGINLASNDAVELIRQYVDASYPSMRRCLNALQINTKNKTLRPPSSATGGSIEIICATVIGMWKQQQWNDARQYVAKNLNHSDYEDFYRFLYQNPQVWSSDQQKDMLITVKIAEYLYKHASIGDPEINLAACLIELQLIANE